jgi:transcriptional regulator with XRE-family HTH domain
MVTKMSNSKTGKQARIDRNLRGLSLVTIADRMGISSPYLVDLEKGRRNWSAVNKRTGKTLLEMFSEAIEVKRKVET